MHQLTKKVASRLSEFYDGFVLCGFVAGSDEPMIVRVSDGKKTSMALIQLTAATYQTVMHEGVPPSEPDAATPA